MTEKLLKLSPHLDPYWLNSVRSTRRTLKDIKRFVDPIAIYRMIVDAPIWMYKRNLSFFAKRDRALLSLLYLTGGRINEVLRLRKSQFSFDDPEFIVIKDYEISKRKKQTIQKEGIPKIDFPLPRVGTFQPFTELVLDYLELTHQFKDKLFRFGRCRAWVLVKYMTGFWCHYFRSQKLSYAVNLFKSALITAKIHGIKSPQTIAHYYKTEWTLHREELKK